MSQQIRTPCPTCRNATLAVDVSGELVCLEALCAQPNVTLVLHRLLDLQSAAKLWRDAVDNAALMGADHADDAGVAKRDDRRRTSDVAQGWREAADFIEKCGRFTEDPRVATIRKAFVNALRGMADVHDPDVELR